MSVLQLSAGQMSVSKLSVRVICPATEYNRGHETKEKATDYFLNSNLSSLNWKQFCNFPVISTRRYSLFNVVFLLSFCICQGPLQFPEFVLKLSSQFRKKSS